MTQSCRSCRTSRRDERPDVDTEENPVIALYVVIAILALVGLAFVWREMPAIIRYIKIERM